MCGGNWAFCGEAGIKTGRRPHFRTACSDPHRARIKPKDAVELILQEAELEHRNEPRVMEKACTDAEDFLSESAKASFDTSDQAHASAPGERHTIRSVPNNGR